MMSSSQPPQVTLEQAARMLRAGGIVAYPTEGVFGLGCDPFNRKAVTRLLRLKHRPVEKGLILIAAGIKDLLPVIAPPVTPTMMAAFNQWPAARTVLFPAADGLPEWIRGAHDTVALRVPAHPLACELCRCFGGPLVSTSANPPGLPAAVKGETVCHYFGDKIDAIIPGQVLMPGQTSRIVDLTGNTIRP